MPSPGKHPASIKVGVVGGYMLYYEPIFGNDYPIEKKNYMDKVTARLPSNISLINEGLIVDDKDTKRVKNKLVDMGLDVLLVIPTMATPPALILPIIEALKVPTVIACAHELTTIDKSYDMPQLCRHSINVGMTMINSLICRNRHLTPPILVSGFMDEEIFHQRLLSSVKAAGLAKRIRSINLGRVGPPMSGYDHVGIDDETAKECGVNVIDIPLPEWVDKINGIEEKDIQIFLNETLPGVLPHKLAKKWPSINKDDDFQKAARMSIALNNVKDRYSLDCGSLSCRGPFGTGLSFDSIGCLATSYQTTIGIPFSATGDLVTALAMYIGKFLGGATLYCELDAVDRGRQAFLVANTGEGDFDWCPSDGDAEIIAANVHSGRATGGVVLRHDLRRSPATMIGVTVDRIRHSGLSLIALEGQTLENPQTSLKVTNGWFKTHRQPALAAFEAWANAATTHHGALTEGEWGEACGWLSQLGGFHCCIIR